MARENNSKTKYFATSSDDALLVTGPGYVGRLAISGVGTTATVTIYDGVAAAGNILWSWVSADGKINQLLDAKFTTGLYIDITGTTPVGFLTYADSR